MKTIYFKKYTEGHPDQLSIWKVRQSSYYKQLRKNILREHHYQCDICSDPELLTISHQYHSKNEDEYLEDLEERNVSVLCSFHHLKIDKLIHRYSILYSLSPAEERELYSMVVNEYRALLSKYDDDYIIGELRELIVETLEYNRSFKVA
ncbi:hypothetical protein [Treponema primitia]|uniref:hypothetical protein n=1 Tax=Treponema primitia TaxID=88058 RepID=UPI0005A11018|nr:hypothetical protein [Treponema primitia]